MSNQRPDFRKKELALSASPYVYLPTDPPVYTVEVSHREEIDGELLQRALDRTLQRMPYLTDTFKVEHGAVYYAENPLPMRAAHTDKIRRVGGAETNWHMLDLTWDGNKTWFSMFHGFCDGQGINAFLESVLYHYYCMKDGVEYDPAGIRTDKTRMTDGETFEPCSKPYEISPDFKMPEKKEQPKPYHIPEIIANPSGDIREYGFRLPSGAFMAFVKENGTSPAVMFSMLLGEAILRLHPDADAPVMSNIPVSVRRMLGCEETFKNCSNRAVLPVSGTPMDALPFAQRAAQLRNLLKMQMNTDLYRFQYNYIGGMYRKRMAEATDYLEEIKKPSGFLTISHDTFYTDYIGSLHKTGYSERITDVRFLCHPAMGNTIHMNIIEHNGQFRVTCQACSDISTLIDAMEQAIRDHGVPFERIPEQCFPLVRTNWRDGMKFD
ncbi:MAG: hypothetical protein IJK06_01005 [Clostridia bacterium]|nr:hypothetical protein [Clostridia bacterium]